VEKLSFTLYEVFGYFLPGAVGVISIAILFWAIFLPASAISIETPELSKLWYFGLMILAYYAGHVLQGISRSLFKNPNDSTFAHQTAEMLQVIKRAKEQLAAHLGMPPDQQLGNGTTVVLCDELAVQYGQLGDRDVFVYREGFYRGSVAAFTLLDLAILVRCLVPGSAFSISKEVFLISRLQWLFVLAVVSCSIFFLVKRYKHFAGLRAMRGVLAFVSLSSFPGLGKKPEGPKSEAS